MRTGPRNLLTDVAGIAVGSAHNARLRSGVTVILPDRAAKAAIDVRGGGPGTRESDALALGGVAGEIHGLVLSGGSAFGLDAATGAQSFLREKGAGFAVGAARVPIVPQAILFDLLNGGDKDWGLHSPYRDLAYEACANAGAGFALGTAGAGYGATVAWRVSGGRMMGGLGSASALSDDGFTVAALAAVNAAGCATIADTPHFWAAPLEIGDEFGGLGWPHPFPAAASNPIFKGAAGQNTTLAVIATDAALNAGELRRIAVMAQTGMARAIYPVHSPLDGDVVFAISTGAKPLADPVWSLAALGALAANALARAIARGVYEAAGHEKAPFDPPTYAALFRGGKSR